jgi:tripartite-type tricarboxylate transporter receptor subunit TctC
LLIAYTPGGATDIVGRLLAQELSLQLGQAVVVENRAGGGTLLATETLRKAAPDGYTLLFGTNAFVITPLLHDTPTYDPVKDFEPISLVVQYPNAILVNANFPPNNLQELIAYAKKSKPAMTYGSDGNGTASHLTLELLKDLGKFDMSAVQYKGAAPMLNDLMSGIVQVGITGLPTAVPLIKSKKIKLIAITTETDFSGSGYPSIASQGFAGFAAAPWSGIFAPKGTARPIVNKISADIATVLANSDVKSRLDTLGMQPLATSPEQTAKHLNEEIAKWERGVKISGATVD